MLDDDPLRGFDVSRIALPFPLYWRSQRSRIRDRAKTTQFGRISEGVGKAVWLDGRYRSMLLQEWKPWELRTAEGLQVVTFSQLLTPPMAPRPEVGGRFWDTHRVTIEEAVGRLFGDRPDLVRAFRSGHGWALASWRVLYEWYFEVLDRSVISSASRISDVEAAGVWTLEGVKRPRAAMALADSAIAAMDQNWEWIGAAAVATSRVMRDEGAGWIPPHFT